MQKIQIRLASQILTSKPIRADNACKFCRKYLAKNALQTASFEVLNEQGELIRTISYQDGEIVKQAGGKRSGAGRPRKYKPRERI